MQPQDSNQTPTQAPAPTPDSTPPLSPTPPSAGDQKPVGKGYGKRPLWQWIVLYVIIGAIVYGLIYWFFFRNTGSTTTGSGGIY
ncbi:MAG TPA: hypothetical protein VNG90_05385 [Candidatus Acidoferrum sp.]|nr:hypothetical protein [Candidatus Acidoferrum sp.]